MADTQVTFTVDANAVPSDETELAQTLTEMLRLMQEHRAGESFKVDLETVSLDGIEILATGVAAPDAPTRIDVGAVIRLDRPHNGIDEVRETFPVLAKVRSINAGEIVVHTTTRNTWYMRPDDEGDGWTVIATAEQAHQLASL